MQRARWASPTETAMTTPRRRFLTLLRCDILELDAAGLDFGIDRVRPQSAPDHITV